jgi:hypothetical protein
MLKVLWVLLLIYLFFRLLTRTLLPLFARNYVKKAQEKFYQQNPDINPEEAKKKEGEVKVKSRPQKSAVSKKELGDYVDFEEVED